MPHADIHAVGVIDELQKPQHIRPVVERLADAHEHNVGDLPPGIELRKEHVVEHFGGA